MNEVTRGVAGRAARQAEPTVPPALHQPDPESLARVVFVLVGTSHPGNVGAAARAMRTMGLRTLRLVAPRFEDVAMRPEARAFASGATEVLDGAQRFGSLAQALADVALVVGVSAEPREFGPVPQPPEACAAEAMRVLQADGRHRVAFVFGAERTGLSIDAVQHCGVLASIPASPTYASLNLAQAIQVIAYCVRREALASAQAPGCGVGPAAGSEAGSESSRGVPALDGVSGRLADQAAIQGLLEHAQRVLVAVGFLDPAHPKKLVPRLRRLVLRARLRAEEVDLLRGVCTQVERRGDR